MGPSGRLLSTLGSPELVTGSSWTPVRSVLEERLVRTPALGMEDLLWSARPSLGDGLWSVWCPGVLDVPLTSLESTLISLTIETGSTLRLHHLLHHHPSIQHLHQFRSITRTLGRPTLGVTASTRIPTAIRWRR